MKCSNCGSNEDVRLWSGHPFCPQCRWMARHVRKSLELGGTPVVQDGRIIGFTHEIKGTDGKGLAESVYLTSKDKGVSASTALLRVIERLRNPPPKPTHIELFAGAGGMLLGFHMAGFDCRCAVEFDKVCCNTLRLNFPNLTIIQKDIRQVTTQEILNAARLRKGECDIITGGPPCQGFSLSNPKVKRFIEDPRNALYREFVRIVREAQPKGLLMENVPGMAYKEKGRIIRMVVQDFRDCGYRVDWKILNAADYGVPQIRKRVFIMGIRKDQKRSPAFPQRTHCSPEELKEIKREGRQATLQMSIRCGNGEGVYYGSIPK